jgi:ATF/CREB family transcription factor
VPSVAGPWLTRSRVAALKCRQRKKQWLANLQQKVEIFSNENDALSATVGQLREEVLNLKTILIAHKDCPIAQQQQGVGAYVQHEQADYANYGTHHGMMQGGQQQQQQVMAGPPRRFS